MTHHRRNERSAHIRRYLSQHGCAFDQLPDALLPESLPLHIYQSSPLDCLAFRIGSGVTGLTGLCLRLELATKASRGVRIEEIEITCDTLDQFDLLRGPNQPGLPYRFAGGFQMEWQDVLNHRIPGVVYPNHPWTGCLVLWAMRSLPPNCKRPISTGITIWDTFGKVGFDTLEVMVDPTTHSEPPCEHPPLSPLFAKVEEPPPRADWRKSINC
jgi:hypothetical protein